MQARQIMTASPACVTPDDPAQRVAQLMADNDCGFLPVVASRDESRVIGVVTDRDLAIRGIAHGKGPETPVRELMTSDPCCCTPNADVREVEQMMIDRQIRRVMIIDAAGCCVGVISQADLARAAERGHDVSDQDVARVVERISEPSAGSAGHQDRTGSTELQF